SRLRNVLIVRLATPAPPVDSPPRPFLRPQADLPAAISACMPSTSCRLRPLTSRESSNGLMWVSIRLRSILSVDALIGRRLRPRMRPASACSRYQSQTSLTDMPARTAWRSADGSSPLERYPNGLNRLGDSRIG